MPTVSVVIATYQWSSALRCALRSVLRQSFQDFEVLVVGDGCTDDSAAVVQAFGDPRLRWENLPANTGSQSAPNNRGFALRSLDTFQSSRKQAERACSCWSAGNFASKSAWPTPISSR